MIRVFITGPQGSGKTELARDFARQARKMPHLGTTTIVDEWKLGDSLHETNYNVVICSQDRPSSFELERTGFTFFDLTPP